MPDDHSLTVGQSVALEDDTLPDLPPEFAALAAKAGASAGGVLDEPTGVEAKARAFTLELRAGLLNDFSGKGDPTMDTNNGGAPGDANDRCAGAIAEALKPCFEALQRRATEAEARAARAETEITRLREELELVRRTVAQQAQTIAEMQAQVPDPAKIAELVLKKLGLVE